MEKETEIETENTIYQLNLTSADRSPKRLFCIYENKIKHNRQRGV